MDHLLAFLDRTSPSPLTFLFPFCFFIPTKTSIAPLNIFFSPTLTITAFFFLGGGFSDCNNARSNFHESTVNLAHLEK